MKSPFSDFSERIARRDPLRRMAAMVVLRALTDCGIIVPNKHYRNGVPLKIKREALTWLLWDDSRTVLSFRACCELMDLSPQLMRERLFQMLDSDQHKQIVSLKLTK